jgi:predicted nucleic acid-binding protein
VACLDTNVLIDLGGRANSAYHAPATAFVSSLQAAGEALCTTRLDVAEL